MQLSNSLTAHDVYLAMTAAVAEAESKDAGRQVVLGLDEAVSRIAQIQDWKDYDVGGTVTW